MVNNLKDLEKKAYTSTHQDGLFELFFGLMLAAPIVRDVIPYKGGSVGLAQLLSLSIMAGAVLVYTLGKRHWTIPRMGYVKFSRVRTARIRQIHLILLPVAMVSLVSLFFFIASGNTAMPAGRPGPNIAASAMMTLLIVVCISLVAYFLQYRRLYVIAILFAATEPAHVYIRHFTDLKPAALYVNTLPAAILLVWGIVLSVSFLKRYPLQDHEGVS